MAVIEGSRIRMVMACPTARKRPWPSIRTILTLTATVFPTASTTSTATECRTVCRVAPQRAAKRIGEGRVEAVEGVGRAAGQDGAGDWLAAGGHSLPPSALAG